ncbi:DUF2827 domain-containing protein [Sphingomonas sp. TDK1]|uniref:DUF2827 domain-containing protein n=1 Tax=Sphingomonas sp. TDK1 TaxID=453247 RepID=UPI0007D9170A|nr:DUF2827 domain-containing protein [Sphingomonas sp. TDK1]OAN59495.1 hypothetical protein A7X12_24645 [Sphingomonas sp. TDK1]
MSSTSKRAAERGLKVGVTLFIRDGEQSLWENGIFQNCYFLVMLLNQSPAVERCFIVNGGSGDPAKAGDFLQLAPAPVIGLDEAMNELDVVIELSAQLNPQWAQQFSERGGSIVGMRVANDFIIDMERMVFKLPPGLVVTPVPYDEIWTLPAFADTCGAYYETIARAPVRVMQHLWNPTILERGRKNAGLAGAFEYQPGRRRWRLAVLEPNICTVKTCHLPLLLCDVAYRQDPNAIELLLVYNAMNIKEHPDFVTYARSMDLVAQGLATFEPRFPIFNVIGHSADAIVSHHWHNAQNYLYYEALYGGFPLIHNSHLLDGCGYRYGSFDPEDGALALRQAIAEHDGNLEAYRRRAQALLANLDPVAEANVAVYGAVLQSIVDRKRAA